MKRRMLGIVLFMFLCTINTNARQINPHFRFVGSAGVLPFIYEPTYNMFGTAFSGSVMGGVVLKSFTIGAEITENYFSFSGNQKDNQLMGAMSILRSTADVYFNLKDVVEFKFGIGGAWFKSAFDYNNTGILSTNYGGLSLLLDALFYLPLSWLQIEIFNQLDLFISLTETLPMPYYIGGVRFHFLPNVRFLSLFLEISGMPWFYRSEANDIDTGLFIWSVGIRYNERFSKQRFIEIRTNYNTFKTQMDMKNAEKTKLRKEREKHRQLIDYYRSIFDQLRRAMPGDQMIFPQLAFNDNSPRLPEETHGLLNYMAEILKDRQAISIGIGGYARYTGDPVAELELATRRAKAIKKYLVEQGVPENRIKILASGSLYMKNSGVERLQGIEIKILKER